MATFWPSYSSTKSDHKTCSIYVSNLWAHYIHLTRNGDVSAETTVILVVRHTDWRLGSSLSTVSSPLDERLHWLSEVWVSDLSSIAVASYSKWSCHTRILLCLKSLASCEDCFANTAVLIGLSNVCASLSHAARSHQFLKYRQTFLCAQSIDLLVNYACNLCLVSKSEAANSEWLKIDGQYVTTGLMQIGSICPNLFVLATSN